jgi:hypothetical protein
MGYARREEVMSLTAMMEEEAASRKEKAMSFLKLASA